jgi:predicted ATPase
MRKNVTAFSGTHGTGKTTAVLRYALDYKMHQPGNTLGIVTEVARTCPWPINRQSTAQGQAWIFSTHLRAELEASRAHDLVVSDRTVMDAIAYTRVLGYHDLAAAMLAMARVHAPIYQRIVFLAPDNAYCFADGKRCHDDAAFRSAVNDALISIYKETDLWASGVIMVK